MFSVDFGLREVSQWRDLEILLQMGSGRARDDFKMPRSGTGTFFEKARFEDFLSKSISYASPRPTTTTKMTAIGFSCYGLFIKTAGFDAYLRWFATLFRKSHFFILSLPRSVLFWFCLPCQVACRQGMLLFSQETRPGQKTMPCWDARHVPCWEPRHLLCWNARHVLCWQLGQEGGISKIIEKGSQYCFWQPFWGHFGWYFSSKRSLDKLADSYFSDVGRFELNWWLGCPIRPIRTSLILQGKCISFIQAHSQPCQPERSGVLFWATFDNLRG